MRSQPPVLDVRLVFSDLHIDDPARSGLQGHVTSCKQRPRLAVSMAQKIKLKTGLDSSRSRLFGTTQDENHFAADV